MLNRRANRNHDATKRSAGQHAPAVRRNWFESIVKSNSKHRCVVGIDIGSDRVEVARIHLDQTGVQPDHAGIRHDSNPGWTWASQYSFPLQQPGRDFKMEDWVENVATQLQQRLPRCTDQFKPLTVVSIPPSWVHYQTSAIDEMDQTKLQCDQIFESSLFQSNSHVAHWPIHGNPTHHQVAATASSAASRLAHAVSSVGYQVNSILSPATAILRFAKMLTGLQPCAVISLSSLVANIAIDSDGDCGLCRTVPAPEAIQDNPFCGLTELSPWLETIASEFVSTMRFARRLGYNGPEEAPVLLCGRLAEIDGVDQAIARLTNRPSATWATCLADRPKTSDTSRECDPRRALSLSLALSGIPNRSHYKPVHQPQPHTEVPAMEAPVA